MELTLKYVRNGVDVMNVEGTIEQAIVNKQLKDRSRCCKISWGDDTGRSIWIWKYGRLDEINGAGSAKVTVDITTDNEQQVGLLQ